MKQCTNCRQWKNESEFFKCRSKYDGLRPHCKVCVKEHQIRYRLLYPKKVRAQKRNWREQNPEAMDAARKDWGKRNPNRKQERYYANRDEELEKRRKYYQNNKEEHRKKTIVWRKANYEKFAASEARRRARKRGCEATLTAQEWNEIKEAVNHCCIACGRQEPDIILTQDHVVPLSKNGPHIADNIQPLCNPCNASKSTKIIDYRSAWMYIQETLLPCP